MDAAKICLEQKKSIKGNESNIIKNIESNRTSSQNDDLANSNESPTNKPKGILDSIGGTIKQGTRKIGYTLLVGNHREHLKRMIIDQFNLRGLKELCIYFNLGSPHPTVMNNNGEFVNVTPKYPDWADFVLHKVRYEELRNYAKNKNRLSPDIIQIENKYRQERIEKYPEYEKEDDLSDPGLSKIYDNEQLLNLVKAIEEFPPVKHFDREELYHTNLYSYLCGRNFEDIKYEIQRGRSRPDMELGDIAIEVKGPTNNRALDTIANKMLRYLQHYNHIILVLFDVNVDSRMYKEWANGIIQQYGDKVTIIRNDATSKGYTRISQKSKKGHCIRCGATMVLNPNRPLCQRCYSSWAYWKNADYVEKYCHICGKKSNQSYSNPICDGCLK